MTISTTHKCSTCLRDLPIECFYHCGWKCKECHKEYGRKYQKEHRKEITEKHKIRNASRREIINKQKRELYAKDKEKIQARNKRWQLANPPEDNRSKILSRCKKAGANIVDKDISTSSVLSRYNYICRICGGKINKNAALHSSESGTIDHVIPLSLGGEHSWENVRAAHHGCNSGKKNRTKYKLVGIE